MAGDINIDNRTQNLPITIPDQKNYEITYGLAFKLASEKLTNLPDLAAQCARSDSRYVVDGTSLFIVLKYLNQTYQVTLPDISITLQDSPQPVELRDEILILHYLTRASGIPLSGQLIAYQELKEGAVYFPSFFKRAVKPLADNLGNCPERLFAAAARLGGSKANLGDASVTIPVFSRVPVTFVIWRGDEEFPPNANILFDSTILDYLSGEDINVISQTISWRLVKALSP